MPDLTGAQWRKSTRSGGNGGDCIEVAENLPGIVAVRDSKDPAGPALTFPPYSWTAFVTAAKNAPQLMQWNGSALALVSRCPRMPANRAHGDHPRPRL